MESSLSFFYNDYATVGQMSAQFDSQVQTAASSSVTANYAALCAIAARQVYSGLEITVGKDSGGNYNSSDIMVFVKEIATSNYVNTVDVMNPAFPFWAYTNPDMIEYAILPVILYSEQTFPSNILSAPHDIGTGTPVSTASVSSSNIVFQPTLWQTVLIKWMRHTTSRNAQTCCSWPWHMRYTPARQVSSNSITPSFVNGRSI